MPLPCGSPGANNEVARDAAVVGPPPTYTPSRVGWLWLAPLGLPIPLLLEGPAHTLLAGAEPCSSVRLSSRSKSTQAVGDLTPANPPCRSPGKGSPRCGPDRLPQPAGRTVLSTAVDRLVERNDKTHSCAMESNCWPPASLTPPQRSDGAGSVGKAGFRRTAAPAPLRT